jgi:hypothetical protein
MRPHLYGRQGSVALVDLTQSGRLARGHSETGAIDRLVPTLYPPAEPNPHKRVEREPIMGTDHVDFYLGRNYCAGYRVLGDGRDHAV